MLPLQPVDWALRPPPRVITHGSVYFFLFFRHSNTICASRENPMKIHVLRSVLCRRHEEEIGADDAKREEEAAGKEPKKPRTKSSKLKKKVASILGGNENRCACCLKPLALSRAVRCRDCGARTCQKNCSRSDHRLDWCCLFCYQQRAWLRDERWNNVFDRLKIEPDIARSLQATGTSLLEETVRGDNVTADTKSAVYTAIRKLVDHAVSDAQKLPSLENSSSSNDAHQDSSSSRKNQDNLLATVIVNKVVAKCQSEQTGNILNFKQTGNNFFEASLTSPVVDGQSQSCDRTLESLPKSPQPISVASKFTQTQPSELLSLMYEERIEEVTAYVSEQYVSNDSYDERDSCNYHRVPFPELGIDIVDHFSDDEESSDTRILPQQSWEENWYFRKKKNNNNNNTAKPAVSMFVPNSNADYRALIGDKDIDETSELSEYSAYSDDEVETADLVLTIKNSLPDDDNGRCNEAAQSSEAAEEKSIARKDDDKLFGAAENTRAAHPADEIFNSNFSQPGDSSYLALTDEIPGKKKQPSEFQGEEAKDEEDPLQRDRECAEHNTLVPRKRCNGRRDNDEMHREKIPDRKLDSRDDCDGRSRVEDDLLDDFNLFAPPIPGSIADREHKKWQNAVPLQNNPYSPENIQKRLVQRHCSPILSSSVLPSSFSSDTTINGNDGFHALAVEDKRTSAEHSEDIAKISENKEQAENVSGSSNVEAKEISLQKKTPENEVDNDADEPSTDSKVDDEEPSKLMANNPCRPKNGLSNTQLIKSYFENGEHKENSRDAVSPKNKPTKNIDGKVIRTKFFRSRQDSTAEAKARKKNCKPVEALLAEVEAEDRNADDKITLPSVKKIVQAFNEKIQEKSLSNPTSQKAANGKSESGEEHQQQDETTTRVIRRTPRQLHLHSLTARSLSREFREGLRQVPKKA